MNIVHFVWTLTVLDVNIMMYISETLKRNKAMKKIIIFALTALMMVGCMENKEEINKNMFTDDYILKEIDSCEYFMVHVSSYFNGGNYLPVHKNNCRFCEERRQKELEELIIKLREK